jgi:hypothetical protein
MAGGYSEDRCSLIGPFACPPRCLALSHILVEQALSAAHVVPSGAIAPQ